MRYLLLLIFLSSCAHLKYVKYVCHDGRVVRVSKFESRNRSMVRAVMDSRARRACRQIRK